MSKPVKEMMIRDYQDRLGDTENAVVISIRGIGANENNRFRMGLIENGIKVMVVRNALARKAVSETPMSGLSELLEGPSALTWGGESVIDVARELVKWAKEIEELELKGAILDGELFAGEEGVKALSKYPTRDEAIAQNITLILSPGRNLMAQVKGPGGRLLGIVKAIEEKLEKGETIAKIN
ncbi:MAG: 50S ribosomal protein L10 [Phycisphaeraceae bacterium]|nr:50S ribosomal protein L10 [Phycisphaeraceae bacterium]